MSKIIVTGASGFIGNNLIDYLDTKNEIYQGVSLRNGISNDLLNDSEVVIHLAGITRELGTKSQEQEYYDVNTKLTQNLFDLFLSNDCKVFIFLSSIKAVADKSDTVLDESIVPNPKSIYGKSKLEAEKYMLNKEIPKDKKVFILRPCMVHGPGNKGNLNILYKFIKIGGFYPLGCYYNKRSYVSVENLCYIIYEIIKGNVESGIYNIADDDSISTNEIVKIIGNITNKNIKILKVNKILIKMFAIFGDYVPIPFNSKRLNKLTSSYEVSNTKIKKALSQQLPVSNIEGFLKTIKSFT